MLGQLCDVVVLAAAAVVNKSKVSTFITNSQNLCAILFMTKIRSDVISICVKHTYPTFHHCDRLVGFRRSIRVVYKSLSGE